MSNAQKEVDEFFAKVDDVMDEAYNLAQGSLDAAFVVVDNFRTKWQARANEMLAKRNEADKPEADAPVKKEEPSIQDMRKTVADNLESQGLPVTAKKVRNGSVGDDSVRNYYGSLVSSGKA